MITKTKLDYVSGSTILPKGAFGISPSQLIQFFDKPNEWYRTQVLGEDATFQGVTGSFLGTISHFAAEDYVNNDSVDSQEIFKYLIKELTYGRNLPDLTKKREVFDYLRINSIRPDIDVSYIEDQYQAMGNCVIQHIRQVGKPEHTEKLMSAEIIPGYYAAGSVDAIHNTTIIDYKSTSELTPKSYIPYPYKLQLLEYCWICRQNGIKIDRIAIKWITHNHINRISEKTGKPMKDYPTQVVPVVMAITEQDYDFIESILKLVAESVKYVKENPETAYIVFKDYRLKEQEVKQHAIFK